MRYEDLKDAICNAMSSVSGEAEDVLQRVLDRYDEDDENIDESDVYDYVYEEAGDYFIYYSDAFDYLQDNSITDYDDAICEGCHDVCSIATYYLIEEVNENLCL